MIVFACKECGKRHRRPDDAGGSVVYCPCGRANRVPWESTAEESPEESRAEERGRRQRDPTRCLDHAEADSTTTCSDCGEAFCPRCVVAFQAATLCGPCKNHRVRRLRKTRRVNGLALAALLVGLVGSPFLLCTTAVPASQYVDYGGRAAAALFGLLIPGTALLLGVLALRQIEKDDSQGGASLAWSGAACGLAGVCLSLSVAFHALLHLGQ